MTRSQVIIRGSSSQATDVRRTLPRKGHWDLGFLFPLCSNKEVVVVVVEVVEEEAKRARTESEAN